MKVLQTLGVSGQTGMPGIFFYRRTAAGIDIYNADATSPSESVPDIHIPSKDWNAMLKHVAEYSTFTLSGQENSLYSILKECGYNQTGEFSRIAAILEHEGSIDLNGRNNSPINLRSDLKAK